MGETILSLILVIFGIVALVFIYACIVPIAICLEELALRIWTPVKKLLVKLFGALLAKISVPALKTKRFRWCILAGFPCLVLIVLLICGKSFKELGELFIQNTIIGSSLSLFSFQNLFSATTIVTIGLSSSIGGWLISPMENEKYYQKILLKFAQVLFTAALSVAAAVPFAAIARWGVDTIAALSGGGGDSVLVRLLKFVPLVLLTVTAVVMILLTVVEYMSTYSSMALGAVVSTIILVVPYCFGIDLTEICGDLLMPVLVIVVELCGVFSHKFYIKAADCPLLGRIFQIGLETVKSKEDGEPFVK